jgi:hypothetical protein
MIEINNAGWIFFQIVLALVILLILYIITLVVLSIDSLVTYPSFTVKQREETTILRGQATSATLANMRYNTIFPFRKDFVKIPQSVNGIEGAQFTYQFWMKINDTNADNFKDLVLLLKGDNKKYKIGYYDYEEPNALIKQHTTKSDYMIKCPLIKFVDNYKSLVVEFNTNKQPSQSIKINLGGKDTESQREDPLTLLPLDWSLLTFVFKENIAMGGIKIQFYLNGKPSGGGDVPDNFLKQNDGDLYLLPNLMSKKDVLSLGDIKYYNYARNDMEVIDDFRRGTRSYSVDERSTNIFSGL